MRRHCVSEDSDAVAQNPNFKYRQCTSSLYPIDIKQRAAFVLRSDILNWIGKKCRTSVLSYSEFAQTNPYIRKSNSSRSDRFNGYGQPDRYSLRARAEMGFGGVGDCPAGSDLALGYYIHHESIRRS